MPVHIDSPAPGMAFDPRHFLVRGWLWLEEQHPELAGVDAWSGGILLGENATFHSRPDVDAKYALPAGTLTAFEFFARHPTAAPGEQFDLQLRARLRDGTHPAPIFASRVGPLLLDNDPLGMLRARLTPTARGLEIGAHTHPTPGLSPYFTDSVALFAGSEGRVDFLADALALPLADNTLDYLCSSHVLEHLPDPLAALHEWHRVLRPGGWLYLVVPDKRFTFDEPRAVTSCAHLFDDFLHARTAATSLEHVDEFVYQTDWSRLRPDTPPAARPAQQAAAREKYLRELSAGVPIDIHFHTFTPDSLHALLRAAGFIGGASAGFELMSHAKRYPPERSDGIAVLLRKLGSVDPRAGTAETFALAHADARIAPLPLVCPVSLSPLRRDAEAGADTVLVATTGDLRYHFHPARPALFPPPTHRPVRPWTDAAWRRARYEIGPFTAEPASQLPLQGHLDQPAAAQRVDPLCFNLRGWAWLGPTQAYIAAIEAWAGDALLGETKLLESRADVAAALRLPAGARTGFDFFAHHPAAAPGSPIDLQICARLTDGARTPPFATCRVTTIARDYRQHHFGILLDQRTVGIQHRVNVFARPQPSAIANPEVTRLLHGALGAPPRRVLDVNCGVGAYARGLLADGYDWLGVETDAAHCAELARQNLPHRQVDGGTLPFPDASFDAAICIDVLHTIDDPHAFLREISRVSRRRLVVSVPNCELLGYLADHLAAPWHVLGAEQKNFFTRWSLGALLRLFYHDAEVTFHTEIPLRTVEGTPLHYHLLAVATSPP